MNPREALRPALSEVAANPRLRLGLWAIVGIVWLYGVLVLRDELPRQRQALAELDRKLARVEAAASRVEWKTRADEARAMQVQLENRLWRASSLGLAQASLHDWLNQAAQESGVTRLQLQVSAQEDALGEGPRSMALWKVTARGSADFVPQRFYAFLSRLAASPNRIVVDSLVIRGEPTPRAELVLVAYFSPTASRNATAAGAEGKS